MSGAAEGWGARVATWAAGRRDIRALVQIGSRVQSGAAVDAWSDYDYQLVTTRPALYRDGSFARGIGPCWATGAQVAFGGAIKATAVFDGALEADFVVLRHWEVLAVMLALRWPLTERWWPAPLRRGAADLRIVAAPGWRVIKGGVAWERRYGRVAPLRRPLERAEFERLCGEFWTQLVWAAKKAARGEFRASQRALHAHLVENSLRVLQEQAALEGRQAHPLGRRAERWLTEAEAAATDFATRPDRASLMAALLRIADVFAGASASVAGRNGWEEPAPRPELRAWLGRLAAGAAP